MKKRTFYTIAAIVIVLGVYGYEHYFNQQERQTIVDDGKVVKEDTNLNFLPSSTTNQVVHHQGYSLSYSEPYEQAEWVAYELKKSQLSKDNYKRPFFEIDKAVKTGAAHWKNYKNSGYDRGHLCPAGDRRFNQSSFEETFLTSNISPQKHNFNAGIWNRLEQKVRHWAAKYGGVYIITGGILNSGLKTIGYEEVAVPEKFYKIVLDYNFGSPKIIAFLIPHQDSDKALYDFVVTVDEIEKLTGVDFFPNFEDALEKKLETSNNYKLWGFY